MGAGPAALTGRLAENAAATAKRPGMLADFIFFMVPIEFGGAT
jgi:hypothetical protein